MHWIEKTDVGRGLMKNIPVFHPFGVASRSKFALFMDELVP